MLNGCTNRDAVWVVDSDEPKEPCIRWTSGHPEERDNIRSISGPLWSIGNIRREPVIRYVATATRPVSTVAACLHLCLYYRTRCEGWSCASRSSRRWCHAQLCCRSDRFATKRRVMTEEAALHGVGLREDILRPCHAMPPPPPPPLLLVVVLTLTSCVNNVQHRRTSTTQTSAVRRTPVRGLPDVLGLAERRLQARRHEQQQHPPCCKTFEEHVSRFPRFSRQRSRRHALYPYRRRHNQSSQLTF